MARLDLGGVAFAALALLTLGSAGVVAFARDLVRSAVGLLGTLVGVTGLYVLLSAGFLAAVQLLVYVGGTSVLFLFAAMLASRGDPSESSNAPGARRLAFFATVLVVVALTTVAIRTVWPTPPLSSGPTTTRLGHALLGEHALPFELASLVLLASLIGAMTVARRATHHRGTPEE